MNAKRTLATLERERKRLTAQLQEESSPRKFYISPEYYSPEFVWLMEYNAIKRHNEAQRAKVDRLDSVVRDITRQRCRIKSINAVRKFFIA